MANHSATKKDVRQSTKRNERNRYYGKTTRNAIRDIRALEDHSTQTVVEVVQHHKALQVLRWDSVLGKECEGARARRSDDLKKLEEITRLLLANKKEINKEVKSGAVAEVGNKKVAGNENHK